MKHEMTFKEKLLEKYPHMDKPTNCIVCQADLQYLFKIHRIGMKWYCNKCFDRYYIFLKGEEKNETIE